MRRRKARAKLYGGPFDGDAALVYETPERIWVTPCSLCGGKKCSHTEWHSEWVRASEVYDRRDDEQPEEGIDVRYVWGQMPDAPGADEFADEDYDLGRAVVMT